MRRLLVIAIAVCGLVLVVLVAVAPKYELKDMLCLDKAVTAMDGSTSVAAGRYWVVGKAVPSALEKVFTVGFADPGYYGLDSIDRKDGVVHVPGDLLEDNSHKLLEIGYRCP